MSVSSKSPMGNPKDKLKTPQRSTSTIRPSKSQPKIDPEPIPVKTNVFLYMQLQALENLPQRDSKKIIRLSHTKNIVSKLEDHYTHNTDIDLNEMSHYNPTFSITLEQDGIDDLNNFSDSPLLITLYEYVEIEQPPDVEEETEIKASVNFNEATLNVKDHVAKKHKTKLALDEKSVKSAGDDDSEEEILFKESYFKPIAQGIIDMMHCFTRKRIFTTMHSYLYPIIDRNCADIPLAVQTTWNVYTLLPLLKELHFNNIAFLTCESIYNPTPELVAANSAGAELIVDLSFQSKTPNESNEYEMTKLCSYSKFQLDFIDMQNPNHKWESLKKSSEHFNNLGLYSGCKTGLHKLFVDLFRSDGGHFNFDEIDVTMDYALVCNSMHRYVLSRDLCALLEELGTFNQQHILVEVYSSEHPEEILLQGILDMSVFIYPRVNACRFAVELRPPNKVGQQQQPPKPTDKKSGGGGERRHSSKDQKERTPFIIIGICLLTPITETDEDLSKINENYLFRNKLKRCQELEKEPVFLPRSQMVEETYKAFDELLGTIIDFIANNNVKSTEEAKAYFCCQMGNIKNVMLKLIAVDFNKRLPSNSSIEFTNLMTTVYKELVARAYDILQNCNNDNLAECYVDDLKIRAKIINFMNIVKFTYEAGDEEMASLLYQKIRNMNKNNTELNFYIFLFDTEKQDFNAAKEYLKRPQKEKWMAADYFAEFIGIYISYMENLKHEASYNESLDQLFSALNSLIYNYPQDMDHWVLMHCLYKKYSYMPGMSYTRWKYENLYDKPRKLLPSAPKSRWELYCNFGIKLRTEKGTQFFAVVQLFVQLGLYKFAEIVFQEIANDCSESERHIMSTTLKILQQDVDKTVTKTFGSNTEELRAFLSQVNGNLEYFRKASDAAMRNYERILDYKIYNYENFELSLMRYGFAMLAKHEYQGALNAFDKCRLAGNGLVAYIGMGRALYGLKSFKQAEHYFAESTKFEIYVPDVWAYLALINLKMGNNFKALEFWKYSKLNPEYVISEEILKELRKINYKDVFLYVDKPL